jgi:polyhydroxyalkanoate synthesis regulator phasin
MTTTEEKKQEEQGLVTRLADKGEETVHRLADEAVKSPPVSRAISEANAARDRFEKLARSAFDALGVAPASELEKLRKEVSRLERRVKKLESAKAPKESAKPPSA